MIVFQDQNEFPIKNMKEIDKTVSTLLIPEHLVEKFLQNRLVGPAADDRRHVGRTDEPVERHGAPLAHFR